MRARTQSSWENGRHQRPIPDWPTSAPLNMVVPMLLFLLGDADGFTT